VTFKARASTKLSFPGFGFAITSRTFSQSGREREETRRGETETEREAEGLVVRRLIWQPPFLLPRSLGISAIIASVTTSDTGVAVKRPNRCYRQVPGVVGCTYFCDTTCTVHSRGRPSGTIGCLK